MAAEQPQTSEVDIVSEYVFLNHGEESEAKAVDEMTAISQVNGEESVEANGLPDPERKPQNGAEAYENLVKSLTECDNDYMKDIAEDAQMDENFGLIDGAILDTFGFGAPPSGLFQ